MTKFDKPFIEYRLYIPLTEEHGANYAESLDFQQVLREGLKTIHSLGKVESPKKEK